MKERTLVSIFVKDFINEIKTQFSTIRVLRTDNALQYTQKDVSCFCASQRYFTPDYLSTHLTAEWGY